MSVAKKRKESTVDDPLPALDGKELEAHIEKMREFQRTPLHVEIENGMLKVFWGTGDTPAARRIVHSFPVTYSLGLGEGGWIHLWDARSWPEARLRPASAMLHVPSGRLEGKVSG